MGTAFTRPLIADKNELAYDRGVSVVGSAKNCRSSNTTFYFNVSSVELLRKRYRGMAPFPRHDRSALSLSEKLS